MSEPLRGIIHVHSDFSRDGLFSIADLAEFGREAGLGFIGLTDHAEDLSSEDLGDFRQQCTEHSDESFVMIPGLEFRCGGDIHILGLGAAEHIPDSDPIVVASQIGASGGIAILAHPGRNGFQFSRELCGVLSGIEIWNTAYDGWFVPPLASLYLLQQARGFNPAISGFGGADLHTLHRPFAVVLQLRQDGSTGVDPRIILHDLRSGKFTVHGKYVSFDAHTPPNVLTCSFVWASRRLYEIAKTIRNLVLRDP